MIATVIAFMNKKVAIFVVILAAIAGSLVWYNKQLDDEFDKGIDAERARENARAHEINEKVRAAGIRARGLDTIERLRRGGF